MSNKSKSPAGKSQNLQNQSKSQPTAQPNRQGPSKNPPRKKYKSLSFLGKIRLFLFFSFPLALYFSYYPRFPIYSSASTNYELSLALIWLALFSLLSLPDVFRIVCSKFRSNSSTSSRLTILALVLFPAYLCCSALWSPNPLRGILTAGIFICILISVVSIVSLGLSLRNTIFPCPLHHLPIKSLKSCKIVPALTSLRRIFLGSAVLISLFCWLQCFLDVFGASRDSTLLCLGCTSRVFGFPHPSGFAIEPQFMGNLLLAPTLLAFYLLSVAPKNSPGKKLLAVLVVFLTTTLFLIFSRGAIYSFSVALLLFIVLSLWRKNSASLISIPLTALSLVLAVSSQALFAYLNQTYSVPPACAVETSLSQLSLDKVHPDLCDDSEENLKETAQEPSINETPNVISNDTPLHTGYIAESTDIRLNLNRQALDLSFASPSASPRTFLFGYGLGSAGKALFSAGKTASEKEIIQNEYLSLLVEVGVVGLLLLALFLFVVLRLALKKENVVLLLPVFTAYALSLLFFSGLPNALHIYISLPFLWLFLPEHKPVVN